MSPAAAQQLQFGAEFLGFLAAIAGVALALLRAGARRPPPLVIAGFAASATAAFIAGSQLLDRGSVGVSVTRGGGAGLILAGVAMWPAERRVRLALVVGAVLSAAAVPLAVFELSTATDAAVASGALAVGFAAIDEARRSVASRIAVSSAASLLVLILVLSVSLSTVLDRNLRAGETRRLAQTARVEAENIPNPLVANAVRFVALANDNLLLRQGEENLARQVAARRADESLTFDLREVTKFYGGQAYLFLTVDGVPLASSGENVTLDPAGRAALIGSDVVKSTTCSDPAKVAVLVIDGQAYAATSLATCGDKRTVLGRFVALTSLGNSYLDLRRTTNSRSARAENEGDDEISLSLLASGTLVARSGTQPSPAEARRLAIEVQEASGRGARSTTIGDRFVGAAPVLLPNQPSRLVLLASLSTGTLSETQKNLNRTLFLIALLGTFVALLLAAFVGERIGSRLRRLTAAAEGVSRGDPGVRTNLGGDDEVGILGSTFDIMAGSIEEKTVAETALRGRIEAVVAGMAEALVATDSDARITDFNQAAEDLIGVSAASARGREVTEVLALASDDGADLQARLKKPPRNRWTASATLHPLDGTAMPVAVSGGPLRDAESVVIGGVVLLRDLRGEREVERMKTEFLSRIGHELRTPLTGVLGYADLLLRREWPPERARMMLEEVHSSARRLERIVELLEFFAAAAAGRTLLRLREVDIRALVDGVHRSWEPKVEPPVQLARKLSRGLPKVIADPRWLRMALDELVDNAKKFSPGGGRIVVGAQVVDDGRVEVFVADRGVGMSAEEVAIAFDDFQQGDTSDTRSFGGLGLGLPLVQRVAEGHGGEVRCATTPGRGTRISILLPVVTS